MALNVRIAGLKFRAGDGRQTIAQQVRIIQQRLRGSDRKIRIENQLHDFEGLVSQRSQVDIEVTLKGIIQRTLASQVTF